MPGHDVEALPGVAVGIDLGTTNTVIAIAEDGVPEAIRSPAGHVLHPSVVGFTPSGERVTGLKARLRKVVDPENTVHSAKRIIGQPYGSRAVQEATARLPYRIIADEYDEPIVVTRAGRTPIIDIASYVVADARRSAEAALGHAVTQCVVTVPAHFTNTQRAATRMAVERAGMRVLRILNEPTAAALAFGATASLAGRVLVFDMGGGTFDATLVSVNRDLIEVIATGGAPYLGGDDMDYAIVEHLARIFHDRHGVDFRGHRHAVAKATIAAEQLKARLSSVSSLEESISELDYGEGGVPLRLDIAMSREELERLLMPIVVRAMRLTERVLADADMAPTMIDDVVLVGGSTRTPLIHRRVAELIGRQPRTDVDPMLAVAYGAAIQAESLTRAASAGAPLLMDVTGHGLGVASAGTYTEFLIEKNTPIPAQRTRIFTTSHDHQDRVDIKVCQGESNRFGENHLLGVIELSGLRPALRGETRIEVSFLLDADGTLQVTARDLGTRRSQQATLRVHGLGEVERMRP